MRSEANTPHFAFCDDDLNQTRGAGHASSLSVWQFFVDRFDYFFFLLKARKKTTLDKHRQMCPPVFHTTAVLMMVVMRDEFSLGRSVSQSHAASQLVRNVFVLLLKNGNLRSCVFLRWHFEIDRNKHSITRPLLCCSQFAYRCTKTPYRVTVIIGIVQGAKYSC